MGSIDFCIFYSKTEFFVLLMLLIEMFTVTDEKGNLFGNGKFSDLYALFLYGAPIGVELMKFYVIENDKKIYYSMPWHSISLCRSFNPGGDKPTMIETPRGLLIAIYTAN